MVTERRKPKTVPKVTAVYRIEPQERAAQIASQRALIDELRARGLPTSMATSILEKLITDRDAAAMQDRVETASARRRDG
jgi:hypothetical protein